MFMVTRRDRVQTEVASSQFMVVKREGFRKSGLKLFYGGQKGRYQKEVDPKGLTD